MFCINVKKTKGLLTELQNQLRALNQILSEVEEKTKCYFAKVEKDECYCQMEHVLESMRDERINYLMMLSTLRETIRLYEETEEEILSGIEAYPKRISTETGWITIEYSEKMNEFIRQVIS